MGPNPMQQGIEQASQRGVSLPSLSGAQQAPTVPPPAQPASNVLSMIQDSPEYRAFVNALQGKK